MGRKFPNIFHFIALLKRRGDKTGILMQLASLLVNARGNESFGIRNFRSTAREVAPQCSPGPGRNALDGSRGAPTTSSSHHILPPDAMVIRKAGPKSDHRPAVMRVRLVPMWRHLFSAAAHFPCHCWASFHRPCLPARSNGSCSSRGGGEYGDPSPWLRADVACHLVGGLPRATLRHRPTRPGGVPESRPAAAWCAMGRGV
jgi:hypothetical protein